MEIESDLPKRKILYLAPFDPTISATGTTTRGRLFLDYFSRRDEVHVVYMEEQHHTEGRDHRLISRLRNVTRIAFSKIGYYLFSRKLYQAAAEKLAEGGFDYIFADFEKAGWYAYWLSQKFHIPYVYNSHNVEYLRYIEFGRTNAIRFLLVPYMYIMERRSCENAMLTVAISELDAQTFEKWVPPERLVTMPSAFDEEIFNPFYEINQKEPPIVLMVGNYSMKGNREGAYLLRDRVVDAVVDKHPDVIFRCIGKNFPEDIRHPNIQAAGFVDDLVAEYQRASLVIVPIPIGGGIRIKTVEALASGKQIIATPKGVEGIDASHLKNIDVTPIDDFAACINNALEKSRIHTTENWEWVRKQFGIRYQLGELRKKIDQMLQIDPPHKDQALPG